MRRADAGEKIADMFDFSQTTQADENGASETKGRSTEQTDEMEPPTEPLTSKIEALAELICGAGDETAGRCLY